MKKLIRVTQDHINYGIASDCHFCPLALAISETLDSPYFVGARYAGPVDRQGTRSVDDVVELPEVAQDFIVCFDTGLLVEPFDFYLEVPS